MSKTIPREEPLQIGWAEADATPVKLPVMIAGQFHVRVSEGVLDPLKVTACTFTTKSDQATFVCCDIVAIPDDLRDRARTKLDKKGLPGFDSRKLVINATHSHAAPEVRLVSPIAANVSSGGHGVELDVTDVSEYVEQLSDQIADVVARAWEDRSPAGWAFGLDYAVVGRNRRWVNDKGVATMYGLNRQTAEGFRHIEGYEDHSLNIVATYDSRDELTGLIVNVPSPSQESEHEFRLSADYWTETRAELRKRFGEGIFILSQCSSAGDQVSRTPFEKDANTRMLQLHSRTKRQEIAVRISDAVERILPAIKPTISRSAVLVHDVYDWDIPMTSLTESDVEDAMRSARKHNEAYEAELARLEADSDLRKQPRWYVAVTEQFRRMRWYLAVKNRFELQKSQPAQRIESHVIRLGDIAFASNPFEYYLDFGIQIKVRSPAVQTFLIQLAGSGTYVPSPRSIQGGGYGSVPASNPVGPEGGQRLAENTIQALRSLWDDGGRPDI